jgi:O-antigen/teichoic acid export membrane protein
VTIRLWDFRFPLVKMVLASGVWMSLAQLSNVLLSGVDLLICNLTLGATLMGVLSLAKTIPHCLANLIASMASVFTPHYTILYVKNDRQELAAEVNRSARIMSFLLTVPIAGFIVFGTQFYTLWQPTKTAEEIRLLQTLSVLNCVVYLFTVHTQCMTMLNSVCNKMKLPVLVSIGTGVVSTALTVLILRFGDLGDKGIYVIAGMSSMLISLKSAFFVPLYAAHILKVKWWTFLPSILRGWLAFGVLAVLFLLIGSVTTITGWMSFLLVALGAAAVGYTVSLPILFDKKEIRGLLCAVRGKLTRGGK